MEQLDWVILRNAIKKRLCHNVEPQDLADAVQDACGFAWQDVERNGLDRFESMKLACYCIARRAVGRVLRGQTFCYEPINRERWEDADYAGTEFYLRNRPGVSEASVKMTRPTGERILPIHTLRKGCHHR